MKVLPDILEDLRALKSQWVLFWIDFFKKLPKLNTWEHLYLGQLSKSPFLRWVLSSQIYLKWKWKLGVLCILVIFLTFDL